MPVRQRLSEFPSDPIFNIKAVEQQTGIAAATLRAWERRHQLLTPERTESGYRLYSEQDIALLHWVQEQLDHGMTISRAIAKLQAMRDSNSPIWVQHPEENTQTTPDKQTAPTELAKLLKNALLNLDTHQADQIMTQAFALYGITEVCLQVIVPTLQTVGRYWEQGEILTIHEHFASNYLRGRLSSMLQIYPQHDGAPHLLVGCAPGEMHELGAMIFAILARQHGYHVSYLGQSVPTEDLSSMLEDEPTADMVILTASIEKNAKKLIHAEQQIINASQGKTGFAYAGSAFEHNLALQKSIAGIYLGPTLDHGFKQLNTLLPLSR